jgi:HAD superfamily phosphatase (TIGR01668 family)
MRLLRATETTSTIFDVDYDRLHAVGKRVLLFDLDNTLGRRGMERLPERILGFLLSLRERGFRVGVLTNRRRNAEDPAVRTLREHVPVVHAAGKPARRGFLDLLGALGATPEAAVMIGDRRLTDVLGANRLGIHSIRVRSRDAW